MGAVVVPTENGAGGVVVPGAVQRAARGKSGAELPGPRAMLGAVETRSVSPVFIGRAAELGTLDEVLAGAAAGDPQALLIGGEAGVGKTRLLEEFAGTARRRGAVVALGGCVEIGADGLPFAPFSTALRALRRELPEQLAAAAAGQEEELARLLPEIGTAAAREAGRHDEDGMARLFELTVRLLERVAAEHTVVLALEDLHWADASTRHLLAYLFRTLRTGRLVVLATYRSDDIHRRHPLRPLLAELDRLRSVRRLELARFTRDEVCLQIAGILAQEPDPDQVDAIFERSDGNAFFVEELAVAAHEGCRTGLTDSLRDLLLVRVEGLPEAAQQVARIVAEGGSTVEYRLLAAVARLAEDDLIEALRAAVNAGILTPAPGPRRPSATTCSPANAPVSTAATPKPWRATRPSSPRTSAPPAWPATGTTPTTRPRPCPPSSTPPSRRAAGTPTPSNCGCWSGRWNCGTTPLTSCATHCAPPTTPRPTRPAAATRPPRR